MRSRGLVVAIAVILAIAAAGAVILYTKGVKQDAVSGGSLSSVIVSSQDIPANTNLNTLIDQGVFSQLGIPTDAVVDGAVTDLAQLKGQTTTAPVLANEQIATSRLSSGEAPAGGPLGISADHVGLPIVLDGGPAGYGVIQRGDFVVVYASFKEGQIVSKNVLRSLLSPAQLQRVYASLQGGAGADAPVIAMPFSFTVTLVSSTRVLDIRNPVNEDNKFSEENIPLTLDLLPEEASAVSYALAYADNVNLGLLPPQNEDGYATPATAGPSFESVVGTAK
ncbi:MAG: SAF domain-containing protein [Actinomycetota bacterium]